VFMALTGHAAEGAEEQPEDGAKRKRGRRS
jgi:hypothetical protein